MEVYDIVIMIRIQQRVITKNSIMLDIYKEYLLFVLDEKKTTQDVNGYNNV